MARNTKTVKPIAKTPKAKTPKTTKQTKATKAKPAPKTEKKEEGGILTLSLSAEALKLLKGICRAVIKSTRKA